MTYVAPGKNFMMNASSWGKENLKYVDVHAWLHLNIISLLPAYHISCLTGIVNSD
jgi:hypothetical protein